MNTSRVLRGTVDPMRNALLFVLLGAVVALGTSACGGSSESSQAEMSPTETWADGVCSALSTYKTTLKETGATLKSGAVSSEGFEAMTQSMKDATQTLRDDLGALQPPQTNAVKTVRTTLQNLSASLQENAQTIQEANTDSLLAAVSVVSTTLLDAQDQVSAAVEQLKVVNARGELEIAFSQAPACSAFPNL
jgi:hypothetical protein